MSNTAVNILVSARDAASAKLNSITASSNRLAGSLSSLAVGAAGIGGGLGFLALGAGAVKAAADFEQVEISFTTMLKSGDKAKVLLQQISDFAVKTPFQFKELAAAGRSLVAFGVQDTQVISSLQRIGDIASGVAAPIGEIAELYGKAKVQGRLFAQDVNQLTNRGIPIIQEFAKQFKVSDDAVRGLVEDGKIGFRQLEKAFISLTSEGGQFFNLMEAQSHSLAGMWSSLSDNVEIAARNIATKAVPALKDFTSELTILTNALNDAKTEEQQLAAKADQAFFSEAVSPSLQNIQSIRDEIALLDKDLDAVRAKDREIDVRIQGRIKTQAGQGALGALNPVNVFRQILNLNDMNTQSDNAGALNDLFGRRGQLMEKLRKAEEEGSSNGDRFKGVGKGILKSFATPLKGVGNMLKNVLPDGPANTFFGFRDKVLQGADALGILGKDLKKVRDIFDSTRSPIEKFEAGQAELDKLVEKNLISPELAARQRQKLMEELQRAAQKEAGPEETFRDDEDRRGRGNGVSSRFLKRAPGAGTPELQVAKQTLAEQKRAAAANKRKEKLLERTAKGVEKIAKKFGATGVQKVAGR